MVHSTVLSLRSRGSTEGRMAAGITPQMQFKRKRRVSGEDKKEIVSYESL